MNGDQRIQNRKERKCNTRSEMVTWAETDPQETDWWSWTWKCYSLNWGTPSVTHLNLISSQVTGHFHMFSWLWITSLRIIYSSSQFTVVFFLLPGALSPSLLEVEGCEIVQETSIMPSSPRRLPPPPPHHHNLHPGRLSGCYQSECLLCRVNPCILMGEASEADRVP